MFTAFQVDPPIAPVDPAPTPHELANFRIQRQILPPELVEPEWIRNDGCYSVTMLEDDTFKFLFYTEPRDGPEFSTLKWGWSCWPFAFVNLPIGDWNCGRLSPNKDDKLELTSTWKQQFPGIAGPCPAAGVPLLDYHRPYGPGDRDAVTLQDEGWGYSDLVFDAGPIPITRRPIILPNRPLPRRPPNRFRLPCPDETILEQVGVEKAWVAINKTICPRRHILEWKMVGRRSLRRPSPDDILGFEQAKNAAEIYAVIHDRGNGIAPRLLAYLTENHGFYRRIIGLAVESFDEGNARFSTPDDVVECQAAIAKLHGYGIFYGPELRASSFLIVGEGDDQSAEPKRAILQEFTNSSFTCDQHVLNAEYNYVPTALRNANLAYPYRQKPPDEISTYNTLF